MKNLAFVTLAILPLFLASCGGAETHEALAEQSVKAMGNLATALEGAKDKATWEAAKPKLEKVMTTLEEIGKKVKALPKADDATEKKIKDKIGTEMGAVQKRMMEAAMKLAAIPEIAPDVQKFMADMGKRMSDFK